MRLRRVCQRHRGGNLHRDLALAHQRSNGVQNGHAAHRRSARRKDDSELEGCSVGDGDDARGAAAQRDRVGQGALARRIEDRVDGLAERTHALDEPFSVLQGSRSERAKGRVVGLGRRRDDLGAAEQSELDAHVADDPRTSVDQQRLALLQPQGLEHTERCLAGDRQCGGQLPGQRLGLRCHHGRERQLRVGPGVGPAEDLVSFRQALHALAELVDDA